MAIDKKNTGCFARSRFGFPNFAESPKFARGSNSYDISWILIYFDSLNIAPTTHNATGAWMQNGLVGLDFVDQFFPIQYNEPTPQDYSDFMFAGANLTFNWSYAQKGFLLISNKTYLPGIYDVTMQYGKNTYNHVKALRLSYPDREYVDYSASFVPLNGGQEVVLTPRDIGAGLDMPLKPGILSAAWRNTPSYYAVDARINTRLLFGSTTQFRLKTIFYKLDSSADDSTQFRGRSVLV